MSWTEYDFKLILQNALHNNFHSDPNIASIWSLSLFMQSYVVWNILTLLQLLGEYSTSKCLTNKKGGLFISSARNSLQWAGIQGVMIPWNCMSCLHTVNSVVFPFMYFSFSSQFPKVCSRSQQELPCGAYLWNSCH